MKSFILSVLPKSVRAALSTALASVRLSAIRLLAKSKLAVYFYYIFDSHFLADCASFVAGASHYAQRGELREVNTSMLRRNIHRIEKGLCFAVVRPSFATSYILETVNQFELLAVCPTLKRRSEYSWAADVLSKYFSCTTSIHPQYLTARQKFSLLDLSSDRKILELPLVYENKMSQNHLSNLMQLLRNRKSVRRYTDEVVPDEVIEYALQAAVLAPTSCNRQPFRYYILSDKAKAQEAASISVGTAGWIDDISGLAVVVGNKSYFHNAVNRHSIYIDSTLSVMPFVLSLEAQGYSTCLINWADDSSRRRRMQELLMLKTHQRVILSIAFGRALPSAKVPFSKRKNNQEISSCG